MAIAKMKLVNIVGRLKDFDTVVRSCCLSGNFHPEQSSLALDNVEEFIPIEEPNSYVRTLQRAVDIGVHSEVGLRYSSFDNLNMSDTELFEYIDKTESEINVLNTRVNNLKHNVARLEQGYTQLSHISGLKLSLDDVFSCKFFNFRFGHLPKDSFPKLEVCDLKDDVYFFPLEEDEEYYWGFYVALNVVCEQVDELFTSLYFEHMNILEEAHGTPEAAMVKIEELLKAEREKLREAQSDVTDYWNKNSDQFLKAYSKIKYLSDSFDLRKYASKCGGNFYVFGWVPENKIPEFTVNFEKLPYVDCVVEGIEEAENVEPPTCLVNNPLTKPFETFTGMYGLPDYNELDPTSFMAFTYTLFFGIMFGDLGQGLCILLTGLFLRIKKKGGDLAGIFIRVGIASSIFGTLYNSVFGFENKLPFKAILPVHETSNVNLVLGAAVALGVMTILICMVLNIINSIKQKNMGRLFFNQNGVAGMVFYVTVILALVMTVLYQKNILSPVVIVCLVVVPLLVIYFQELLSRLVEHKKELIPGKKGEFFLTGFFELFEVLLSFLSNTISFIRIGAYVLSHAGMMVAVYAIVNLCPIGVNYVVAVLGNIFVIALEGLIVGIQGIRLQFYEMFSRFYNGGGKPYEPAKIDY